MPVSYRSIPMEQLLCHAAAYNLIDIAGHIRFENWDIGLFEKDYLGCDGYHYIRCDDDKVALLKPLATLDRIMPFLKFGEEGQHYGYELFLSKPEHWGLRGDPFFWVYAARRFTYDRLPMKEDEFSRKYMSIVRELNIPYGTDDFVHIEMFAAGGMSSGCVSGKFVEEAHELLLRRLKKY